MTFGIVIVPRRDKLNIILYRKLKQLINKNNLMLSQYLTYMSYNYILYIIEIILEKFESEKILKKSFNYQ